MHCRLLTQDAIIMVKFLAGLQKKKKIAGRQAKTLGTQGKILPSLLGFI